MRVKWIPFCNFRGPFFIKGVQERVPQKVREKTNIYWPFAAILERSGQLKKPGLELLQNPGCLSGEIMTQMKERQATERVWGYKSSK